MRHRRFYQFAEGWNDCPEISPPRRKKRLSQAGSGHRLRQLAVGGLPRHLWQRQVEGAEDVLDLAGMPRDLVYAGGMIVAGLIVVLVFGLAWMSRNTL